MEWPVLRVDLSVPHSPEPVFPGDVASMNEDRFIMPVVSDVLEEEAAA